jgi:hypothetical protein
MASEITAGTVSFLRRQESRQRMQETVQASLPLVGHAGNAYDGPPVVRMT